jgi:orotate phosphoribosyltransferase
LEKKIEGSPEEPIVISDDVITSGQRVKDAKDTLNQARYSAKGVVRDRQRGRWDGECSKGA